MLWRTIKGLFNGIWSLLKGVSKAISVLLPIALLAYFIGAVVVGLRAAQPEPIPEQAALLVNPAGVLVENRTPLDPIEALMQGDSGEVLLPALVKSINAAAEDNRITALVMDLQLLVGPTVTQTFELRAAVDAFKASGKDACFQCPRSVCGQIMPIGVVTCLNGFACCTRRG